MGAGLVAQRLHCLRTVSHPRQLPSRIGVPYFQPSDERDGRAGRRDARQAALEHKVGPLPRRVGDGSPVVQRNALREGSHRRCRPGSPVLAVGMAALVSRRPVAVEERVVVAAQVHPQERIGAAARVRLRHGQDGRSVPRIHSARIDALRGAIRPRPLWGNGEVQAVLLVARAARVDDQSRAVGKDERRSVAEVRASGGPRAKRRPDAGLRLEAPRPARRRGVRHPQRLRQRQALVLGRLAGLALADLAQLPARIGRLGRRGSVPAVEPPPATVTAAARGARPDVEHRIVSFVGSLAQPQWVGVVREGPQHHIALRVGPAQARRGRVQDFAVRLPRRHAAAVGDAGDKQLVRASGAGDHAAAP